ncbi:hypothetical protein IMZ16_02615 [Cruoricaptor ignavus]|uniref:Uncharacterized protein n=1 Tax=Cruoricaptor ignavus TaxID=1118202 RepID=A0A7M1T651_9FLAO|nr:hypothetical protein [Cruoricaptor ignavus]QOR74352.1 hypothetical protein IMZ16_02615 [Cruoricaptor ignavus]
MAKFTSVLFILCFSKSEFCNSTSKPCLEKMLIESHEEFLRNVLLNDGRVTISDDINTLIIEFDGFEEYEVLLNGVPIKCFDDFFGAWHCFQELAKKLKMPFDNLTTEIENCAEVHEAFYILGYDIFFQSQLKFHINIGSHHHFGGVLMK